MAPRRTRWRAVALLLLCPPAALALGLGDIELHSALNQPLEAEIALRVTSEEQLDGLRVAVASDEDFQRFGLERPALFSDLWLEVVTAEDGRAVVRMRSTQAVREPLLTLLVEARWSRGHLLREYTLLLDPPAFSREAPAPAEVTMPTTAPAAGEPGARAQLPDAVPMPESDAAPAVEPSIAEEPAALTHAGGERPLSASAAPSPDGNRYTVQRDETLWSIAERLRPGPDITTNQMMVALFESNPQAFVDNVNHMLTGATLRVPDADTVRRISVAQADAQVRAQHQEWESGAAVELQPRLRLVPPPEAPPDRQAAGGEASESPGDAAAQANGGSALESLRSETGALREEAGALREQVQSLQEELVETHRLIEVQHRELQALQQRVAALPDALAETRAAPPEGAEAASAIESLERTLTSPQAWLASGLLVLLTAMLFYRRHRRRVAAATEGYRQRLDGASSADDDLPEPEIPGLGDSHDHWARGVAVAAAAADRAGAADSAVAAAQPEAEQAEREDFASSAGAGDGPGEAPVHSVSENWHLGSSGTERDGFGEAPAHSVAEDFDLGSGRPDGDGFAAAPMHAISDDFGLERGGADSDGSAEPEPPAQVMDEAGDAAAGVPDDDGLEAFPAHPDPVGHQRPDQDLAGPLPGEKRAQPDDGPVDGAFGDDSFGDDFGLELTGPELGAGAAGARGLEQPAGALDGALDDEPPAAAAAGGDAPDADEEDWFSLDDLELADLEERGAPQPTGGGDDESESLTAVDTQLDLARAYLDMGDPDGARSVLEQVLIEGDPDQRQQARQLLDSL